MLAADIPAQRFSIPFANAASGTYKAVIPTASQIGVNPGRASLTDGFPPLNFTPVASGGIPPFGKDMNGILYEISGWSRWYMAGGPIVHDATFSAAIGGYPAGAVLSSDPAGSLWLSTVDNNVTDPDTGGAGWVKLLPVKAPDPADDSDDTNFVTPAGLADVLAMLPAGSLLSQNGYYTLPGGLIVQWGRFNITGAATLVVGFPLTFPAACFSVVAGGSNSNLSVDNNNVDVLSGSITASQFTATYGVSGASIQATFLAVGH